MVKYNIYIIYTSAKIEPSLYINILLIEFNSISKDCAVHIHALYTYMAYNFTYFI